MKTHHTTGEDIASGEEHGAVERIILNISLYPLERIFSSSYAFQGKAHIIIDEDEGGAVIITLHPKTKEAGKNLRSDFLAEIERQARAESNREQNRELKRLIRGIPQSAPNHPTEVGFEEMGFEALEESLNDLQFETLEDSLGISAPWGDTGKVAEKASLEEAQKEHGQQTDQDGRRD